MEVVPVDSTLRAHPGYETAEAAIAAAAAHPLQPAAREAASHFSGRELVDGWPGLDQWVLEFSGPLWLRVFADRGGVGWSVERERPELPAAAGPVVFEWTSGARSEVDAAQLIAIRRGAMFCQFWADETGFYVYFRRRLILSFSAVRRRDTGEPLLHVWEEV